ncbi:signal recognition particle-docking protein FtsY [Candidatus Woesearchaeota archaeon]|nr:signal recognition particle-docking protein FtsY [Candidatus Woesearchaeota archaeon]
MFKFLKDKFKDVVDKFSKKVEEEGKDVKPEAEEKKEDVKQEPKKIKPLKKALKEAVKFEEKVEDKLVDLKGDTEKKSFFESLKEKFAEKPEKPEVMGEISDEEIKKKSFLASVKEKVTTKKINEKQFDEFFWDIELGLMENNVAAEVIDKIKDDLKKNLVDQPLKRGNIEETIIDSLKKSLGEVLNFEPVDLVGKINESEKPFVIIFFGINGAGKTTTIAKVANLLMKNKLKCLLVAADTFRAAAIQQLEEHGKKLGIKVVRQDYGSDPAAVAFDGVKSAKARGIDVVLIDTAGRQHSNENLMEEMKKIVRVIKPNMKLFIGESITGNDCIEQVKKFDEIVKIDGIILSKADIDEKGGTALSVSYVSGKPILFFGVGQKYDDLKQFDKDYVLKNLGLN